LSSAHDVADRCFKLADLVSTSGIVISVNHLKRELLDFLKEIVYRDFFGKVRVKVVFNYLGLT